MAYAVTQMFVLVMKVIKIPTFTISAWVIVMLIIRTFEYRDENSICLFRCVPDCGDTCVNGECTAPNVCNCTEGYHKNSDGVCEAMCENECVNGKLR